MEDRSRLPPDGPEKSNPYSIRPPDIPSVDWVPAASTNYRPNKVSIPSLMSVSPGGAISSTSAKAEAESLKCPNPNCTKVYKQANGLKYHLKLGKCSSVPPKPGRTRAPPPLHDPVVAVDEELVEDSQGKWRIIMANE